MCDWLTCFFSLQLNCPVEGDSADLPIVAHSPPPSSSPFMETTVVVHCISNGSFEAELVRCLDLLTQADFCLLGISMTWFSAAKARDLLSACPSPIMVCVVVCVHVLCVWCVVCVHVCVCACVVCVHVLCVHVLCVCMCCVCVWCVCMCCVLACVYVCVHVCVHIVCACKCVGVQV